MELVTVDVFFIPYSFFFCLHWLFSILAGFAIYRSVWHNKQILLESSFPSSFLFAVFFFNVSLFLMLYAALFLRPYQYINMPNSHGNGLVSHPFYGIYRETPSVIKSEVV